MDAAGAYLDEAFRSLRGYRRLGEGAMAQVSDEQLFVQLDPESNSIAVIVRHLNGNMKSRFTDFLVSDGEKPWRNRDQEFEQPAGSTRAEVMQAWDEGWDLVLSTVKSLQPADVGRTVTIRGEPHTVLQAVSRQVAHYAYHVGQIVFVAKHLRSSEWKSLSIPRGKSAEFNRDPERFLK
jgi:hypothetical protein